MRQFSVTIWWMLTPEVFTIEYLKIDFVLSTQQANTRTSTLKFYCFVSHEYRFLNFSVFPSKSSMVSFLWSFLSKIGDRHQDFKMLFMERIFDCDFWRQFCKFFTSTCKLLTKSHKSTDQNIYQSHNKYLHIQIVINFVFFGSWLYSHQMISRLVRIHQGGLRNLCSLILVLLDCTPLVGKFSLLYCSCG